jgi:hypothetical protein
MRPGKVPQLTRLSSRRGPLKAKMGSSRPGLLFAPFTPVSSSDLEIMNQSVKFWLGRSWNYFTKHSIFLPFVILEICFLALISPVGEFPLNDDWIYTKTVQHLLETGHYQAHPYLNATLILQAYWGALFCKLFGFTFTTLRCSTLALSCINAWAVARCGLSLGLSRPWSLLCGTVVMTQPLMLGLSYSFMTDIPFLTLATLAGLCFLKALKGLSTPLVLLGSVLGVGSFFVRQFGLLIPLAFVITLGILQFRQRIRPRAEIWLAILSPWVIAACLYWFFAPNLQSETPILESTGDRLWVVLLDSIRYLPVSLTGFGALVLPLGLVQIWQGYESWNKQQWILFGGFCGTSLVAFVLPQILFVINKTLVHKESLWLKYFPYRMPFFANGILLNLGFGNDWSPNLDNYPVIDCAYGWWVSTLLGLGVGGAIIVKAWEQFQFWRCNSSSQIRTSQALDAQILFLWLWVFLALLVLWNPWRSVLTDRYLLVAYVPLTLVIASEIRSFSHRKAIKWAALGAGIVLVLGLVLVQDYMAWNRTASTAQYKLMDEDRISAAAIAGIDALNGWYNSEQYMKRYNTRNWWDLNIGGKGRWVLDDRYVISSKEPRPGYKVLERMPYFSWWGWQTKNVVIFKRLGS